MHVFTALVSAYALVSGVNAQSAGASVPSDLSSRFDEGSVSLQTSFTDRSDEGFKDGSKFTTQETSKQPVFALGDSSGVNTALKFLIMMVDTTEEDKRVLHFLQTDFQASGEKTGIASDSEPMFAYKAPGTLGESGERQYSFLLYQQLGSFQGSDMPSSGDAFDVKSFQSSNNLKDPLAGNSMMVDAEGSSDASGSSGASESSTSGSSGASESSGAGSESGASGTSGESPVQSSQTESPQAESPAGSSTDETSSDSAEPSPTVQSSSPSEQATEPQSPEESEESSPSAATSVTRQPVEVATRSEISGAISTGAASDLAGASNMSSSLETPATAESTLLVQTSATEAVDSASPSGGSAIATSLQGSNGTSATGAGDNAGTTATDVAASSQTTSAEPAIASGGSSESAIPATWRSPIGLGCLLIAVALT